jgi:hypothetical protein
MITMFSTAQQFIALDALLKGQKYNQEYFVQKIFPSLLTEKTRFPRQKAAISFLCAWTTQYVTMDIELPMNYVA